MEWPWVYEKNRRIASAVNKGKDVLEHVPEIHTGAMEFYRRFEGTEEAFKDCKQSLELAIVNGSNHSFKFANQYFKSGSYFVKPSPIDVHPGRASVLYVCGGHDGNPEDVSGGFDYAIFNGLHLYIGFENTVDGQMKTFMAIDRNKTAKWAYEMCQEAEDLCGTSSRFHMNVSVIDAKRGGDKMIEFTVTELHGGFRASAGLKSISNPSKYA